MTALSIGFDVPFSEAIRAAATRGVVLPDVYYGELQGVASQLAFSIAGISAYDQLQAVRDSMAAAMAAGTSFKEWKALDHAVELPAHRMENIWRTNLQGNYMRGRWEQFTRNARTRKYLIYDAINDTRVRPSHLAHDGVIRAVDDPFWKTHSPPLGYRCRCTLRSLTEEQARARSGAGKGLYQQPTHEDGTPAQPDKGWDYNPFGDVLAAIRKGLRDRAAAPNARVADLESISAGIEGGLVSLYAEWVSDHGEDAAREMWQRNFGDTPTP